MVVASDDLQNSYVGGGKAEHTVFKVNPVGEVIASITRPVGDIRSITVDKQNNIYSGEGDGSVSHCITKYSPTGEFIWADLGHQSGINGLITDDTLNVYSASWDKTSRKLSPTGTMIWKFTTATSSLNAISRAPDGSLYLGSGNGILYKLFTSGAKEWEYVAPDAYAIRAVALDNSENIYISGNRAIRKISPAGKLIWEYKGIPAYIWGIQVDNENNIIVLNEGNGKEQIIRLSQAGVKIGGTINGVLTRALSVNDHNEIFIGDNNGDLTKLQLTVGGLISRRTPNIVHNVYKIDEKAKIAYYN